MLSLFGYDPEGDHYRITREQGTRRINLAVPEKACSWKNQSARFLTPEKNCFPKTRTLASDGGLVEEEELLTTRASLKPQKLELFPPELLLEGNGASQQMTVLAHYSDGTTKAITKLTVFHSNNELSASIDENGLVTAEKEARLSSWLDLTFSPWAFRQW